MLCEPHLFVPLFLLLTEHSSIMSTTSYVMYVFPCDMNSRELEEMHSPVIRLSTAISNNPRGNMLDLFILISVLSIFQKVAVDSMHLQKSH